MRWAAASSVTSAEIVATPSRRGRSSALGVAGDDRHLGAVRDQRLDQPKAKTTASAGDDDHSCLA
jgi:hypothetical protein